jgi:hypothetical protein
MSLFRPHDRAGSPGLDFGAMRLGLAAIFVIGCSPPATWRKVEVQPAKLGLRDSPACAEIILATGESLLVESPMISHDTLRWRWPTQMPVDTNRIADLVPGDSAGRYAIPLTQVKAVLVQYDGGLGAGGVVMAVVWTIAASVAVLFFAHPGTP